MLVVKTVKFDDAMIERIARYCLQDTNMDFSKVVKAAVNKYLDEKEVPYERSENTGG